MKKVVKFGGSSLADARQFEKAGAIVRAESSRRFVVPSAPGKRTKDDTKVTDMLYGILEKNWSASGSGIRKLWTAFPCSCLWTGSLKR